MPTKDSTISARDRLLDAARDLMLSRGFVAASVDAICSSAGLTKGSFFHYFSSKEELAKVLLARFAQSHHAGCVEVCSAIEDPLERVVRVIDHAIEGTRRPEMKGCLIGTVAQEVCETHPELREVCKESFEGFAAWLARDLVAAKELYCPDADFDAESLGHYFLSIAQGSMLLLRTNGERSSMEKNLRHFRQYVRSLYGR